MKFVALLSGGKDSCYSILKCQTYGHELVCLANLTPNHGEEEINSFMYQSAAHQVIPAIAACLNVPLVRRAIVGSARVQTMEYQETDNDEVEDLYKLLLDVLRKFPDVEAVSCGAIVSNYQRVRVENVCKRLNLSSLSYLWQRDRSELLSEIIDAGVHAVLVKVAGAGLVPNKHLGKDLGSLKPTLVRLNEKFGLDLCGEGGEYETLVLDCPNFQKRIVIDSSDVLYDEEDISVANLCIRSIHLEDKSSKEIISYNIAESLSLLEENNEGISCRNVEIGIVKRLPETIQSNKEDIFSLECDTSAVHCGNDGYVTTHLILPSISTNPSSVTNVAVENEFESDVVKDIVKLQTANIIQQLKEIIISLNCRNSNSKCYSSSTNALCLRDVSFIHLYLSDMSLFDVVNKEYISHFDTSYPHSRCCVAVKSLPLGAYVALSATVVLSIAAATAAAAAAADCGPTAEHLRGRQSLNIKSISEWGPICIGPYCQAVHIHKSLVLVAGQIGLEAATMQLVGSGLSSFDSILLQHIQTDVIATAVYRNTLLQLGLSCKHIKSILSNCNSTSENIISVVVYVNAKKIRINKNLNKSIRQEIQRQFNRIECESSNKRNNSSKLDWIPFEFRSELEISLQNSNQQMSDSNSSNSRVLKWFEVKEIETEREDEEEDDNDDEELLSSLVTKPALLPVCIVPVADLPKGALVEIEIEATTQLIPFHLVQFHVSIAVPKNQSEKCDEHSSSRVCNSSVVPQSYTDCAYDWPIWNSVPTHTRPTIAATMPTSVSSLPSSLLLSFEWELVPTITDHNVLLTHPSTDLFIQSECSILPRSICKGFAQFVDNSRFTSQPQKSYSLESIAKGLIYLIALELVHAEMNYLDLKRLVVYYSEEYFESQNNSEFNSFGSLLTELVKKFCMYYLNLIPNISLLSIPTTDESLSPLIVQFNAMNTLQLETELWIWDGRQR